MATMKSRISSSSFTYEYDVFISFRGVDTRSGFTSNLYKALCEKGVKAFMDDQDIKPGEEINQALDKAIQKSRIALVIFSQNYASSTFCLEELAKIVECSKDKGMLVMPVFYQVDPAEVRHHRKGSYAKALAKHETRNEKEKIETWRVAMKKVANIYGWHIKDDRPEDEFIDKIFKSISKEISSLGDGDKKKIFSNVGDKYVAQHNKVNCYKAQGLVTKELEIGIPTENREREFITQKEREMGRAPCCDKANVKKCPWSPAEDSKLKWHIMMHGTEGNWITLPQRAGLKRSGESCRLRWLNYLRPGIKRGEFSDEEDRIICSLYASIGSRWSIIAAQLPGRTDNDIKNYWNTKLKKKFMGFLPPSISHHQQRKSPYQSSPHQNPTFPSNSSLSSSIFLEEPLPVPCTTSMISLPFYQNQESLVSVSPMQYYYPNSVHMFGSEVSCSSSDGSCSQVKQEEMGFQNYMSSGFEEYNNNNNNTFMLCNNQWEEEKPNGYCFFQTMDYELEVIKQLISSNNGYFSIDENKGTTEEKVMFNY